MGYKPQPRSLLCRDFITCKYLLQLLMMALVIHNYIVTGFSCSYFKAFLHLIIIKPFRIWFFGNFVHFTIKILYTKCDIRAICRKLYVFLLSRGTQCLKLFLRNVNFFFFIVTPSGEEYHLAK